LSKTWVPSEHGRDRGGLQKRVARGLLWTLIDTWGSQLLALVVFIILAQLLQPVDFGLVALASVFVALGQVFVDQGLGDAIIQRPRLTVLQIDTAFWAALLTGAILSAVGILLAGPIATLLGDQRLLPLLQVLSLVFVLVAFNSIQIGLLRREMNFRSLAVRKLVAIAIGGVVGIALALAGAGAWALVGQQLANGVMSVVMLWAVSPWRPSFAFSVPDFRSLFSFGLNVVAGDLLTFVSRNTDNLLVGVFLGPVPLGFYAVAYKLLDTSQVLLVAAARRLVFPSFARLQHDVDRTRRAYIRMTRSTSALTLPGYIGLALVAHEAIVVIFGQKWAASATAASILFTIGPVLTIQAFSGAVWNAVGKPGVTLRFRLISMVTNVVGFVLAVTIFRDIVAVAAAFVLRGYLLLPLNLYWMRKYAHVPVAQQLWQLRGVALATAAMAIAVIGIKAVLAESVHGSVLLAAEVLVGAVVFFVALFVLDRALVKDLVSMVLHVVPRGERLGARLGLRLEPREAQPTIPFEPALLDADGEGEAPELSG
jgi:O-antigen/teichoic acid export membrane protein